MEDFKLAREAQHCARGQSLGALLASSWPVLESFHRLMNNNMGFLHGFGTSALLEIYFEAASTSCATVYTSRQSCKVFQACQRIQAPPPQLLHRMIIVGVSRAVRWMESAPPASEHVCAAAARPSFVNPW